MRPILPLRNIDCKMKYYTPLPESIPSLHILQPFLPGKYPFISYKQLLQESLAYRQATIGMLHSSLGPNTPALHNQVM